MPTFFGLTSSSPASSLSLSLALLDACVFIYTWSGWKFIKGGSSLDNERRDGFFFVGHHAFQQSGPTEGRESECSAKKELATGAERLEKCPTPSNNKGLLFFLVFAAPRSRSLRRGAQNTESGNNRKSPRSSREQEEKKHISISLRVYSSITLFENSEGREALASRQNGTAGSQREPHTSARRGQDKTHGKIGGARFIQREETREEGFSSFISQTL